MKVWIVGPYCSLKSYIIEDIVTDNPKSKIGKLFTNNPEITYHRSLYNYYSDEVINKTFEADSYVMIKNVLECDDNIYEGIDIGEYNDKDIFCLTIDQFINLNTKYISKCDLIVYVDGDKEWRRKNAKELGLDFEKYNSYEMSLYDDFCNMINNLDQTLKNVLYFLNEDPGRIKAIIRVIYDNPKLFPEFYKYYK